MLAQYDGYVVTHTMSLALIYEPLGKPVIGVNTCRYDQPSCWTRDEAFLSHLNRTLRSMHARGQLHLVSNNRADAAYLHLGCGLATPVVPSLCTYTEAAYTGRRKEWVLMCPREMLDVVPPSARGLLLTLEAAFGTGRTKYEWEELYDMAGVVMLPYEASTMQLFELYAACVPVLVPDAALLRELGCLCSLAHYGGGHRGDNGYGRRHAAPSRPHGSARGSASSGAGAAPSLDLFLEHADFYDAASMPHVHTFRSLDELGAAIRRVDVLQTSAAMAEANRGRARRVRAAWRCLMLGAFPTQLSPPAVAVCLSGAVRSFPREAFRASFRRFRDEMPPLDVFAVLKMSCGMGTLLNSVEGVEQFMQTMRALRPKAVLLYDRHADEHVDACAAASQLLGIDESFRLAEAHGTYAYYVRYRPDFVMMETRLDWACVRDDAIYTSQKIDAPASDQLFLVSRGVKQQWWGKRFELDDVHCACPEYTIFNTAHPVYNGPCFHGGLLRPAETAHVLTWDKAPQQQTRCSALEDERQSQAHLPNKGQLPLSHRPLQARFREMIHARMQQLGIPYEYVKDLTAAWVKERRTQRPSSC